MRKPLSTLHPSTLAPSCRDRVFPASATRGPHCRAASADTSPSTAMYPMGRSLGPSTGAATTLSPGTISSKSSANQSRRHLLISSFSLSLSNFDGSPWK